MKAILMALIVMSSVEGHKLNKTGITRDETARVIENAMVNRILPKLNLGYEIDPNMSYSEHSLRGENMSHEDYLRIAGRENLQGPNVDPVLRRAVYRIEHPTYAYKRPDGFMAQDDK